MTCPACGQKTMICSMREDYCDYTERYEDVYAEVGDFENATNEV